MKKNIIFDKSFLNQNGISVDQVNATNIIVEQVSQTGDLSIDGNLTISNDLNIGSSNLYTNGVDLYLNNVLNCNGLFLNSSNLGITNNNSSSTNIMKGNYTYYNNVYLNGTTTATTQASSDNSTKIATTAKSQAIPTLFTSDVSFNSNISVGNNIYFNGNLYQNGNLFAGGSSNIFTGNVSITGNLSVSGNVTATSFNATSDRRIKQNILPIINETIDLIKPRKYFNKLTNKEEFGVIADELQEVYSNIVNGEKDGDVLQSVNYIQMIPLLIKEVQELKNKFKLLNI